jgi:hypothetical protein
LFGFKGEKSREKWINEEDKKRAIEKESEKHVCTIVRIPGCHEG